MLPNISWDSRSWPTTTIQFPAIQACVRPLYDVYDQDGDGLVSMEEFIGCQTILQNSLGLKSKVSLEAQLNVGQSTAKAKNM